MLRQRDQALPLHDFGAVDAYFSYRGGRVPTHVVTSHQGLSFGMWLCASKS